MINVGDLESITNSGTATVKGGEKMYVTKEIKRDSDGNILNGRSHKSDNENAHDTVILEEVLKAIKNQPKSEEAESDRDIRGFKKKDISGEEDRDFYGRKRATLKRR